MSVNTIQDYLDLITSEHANKPKFVATVALSVAPFVQIQSVYAQMNPLFDVDVAVGDQLDIIGQWVGISRDIETPITGIYFTWDDAASDGWDFGIWQGANDPSEGITVLPDDVYRDLVKGKIAANSWDGTVPGAYAVLAIAFPTLTFLIEDHQDMTMTFIVIGATLNSLTKQLIVQGYIPLKPEGVAADYLFSTATPVFAWDVETTNLAGWDQGTWIELS